MLSPRLAATAVGRGFCFVLFVILSEVNMSEANIYESKDLLYAINSKIYLVDSSARTHYIRARSE